MDIEDEIDSKTDTGFWCLLIISVLFILSWIILDQIILYHEENQLSDAFWNGQITHHQYFANYGTRILTTWWGLLMLRIVPVSILCVMWLTYCIFLLRSISKATDTEEFYQWDCKQSLVHISFVSTMPYYNLENYSQPDMNSFILFKNDQKIWRLFKLNSLDQKDWNASKWKAEENEIQISDVDGLEEIIKELPDVMPENIPPKEKMYVLGRIETLLKT